MTSDEILKLKAVVLFVLGRCKKLDYFHLFKILYFADRAHYATYGRRIIADTFCALQYGPVPSALYDAVKDVIGVQALPSASPLLLLSKSLVKVDSTYLKAKEKFDADELSRSDIEALDASINENRNKSFDELSQQSHDEAWTEAYNNPKNTQKAIEPLTMAKAAGANEDTLQYLKEQARIDAALSA
ncbi:MAG: SocA family protein [Tannerella sp.]|jgi:uncharacterized phage-associated protein|nr:SocA family protein [Tannerella sp.]